MIEFLCLVAMVTDGDTFRCADGTRVRLALVNAQELHGAPCPRNRPCPAMPARQAKAALERMILGRTLHCRQVGVSYRRVVADCDYGATTVSCATVKIGATAWWESYAKRYRMRGCAR